MRIPTSAAIAIAAAAAAAFGQTAPGPAAAAPAIAGHRVEATIDAARGVAHVHAELTIRNPTAADAEFELVFPAGEDASLDSFHLAGPEGRPIPARVYPAAEARRIYEEIVRRRRDPALLEHAGRALFHARIFPIPARGESRVRLSYSEALRAEGGLYRFWYGLPADAIEIRVVGRPATLYSPTHAFEAAAPAEGGGGSGGGAARLLWRRIEGAPEPPPELALFVAPPAGAPVDGRALVYRPAGSPEGYFLLLLSPNVAEEGAPALPKNMVLVFDRSGSMAGLKIEQARAALRHVLRGLNAGDTFQVIAYNDAIQPFRPEPVAFAPETRDAALRFVDALEAEGGTNIHDALLLALAQLPAEGEAALRPSFVLFLTDGIPTIGAVRDPNAIVAAVEKANARGARICVFGVGHDVNTVFLDRLAARNRGIADYAAPPSAPGGARPAESIEAKIFAFYASIRHPALSDLRLSIGGVEAYDLYPRELPDLFRGRPLVVAGRFRASGSDGAAAAPAPASGAEAVVALSGRAGGAARRFEWRLPFARGGAENAFVARLWATRRIGALVDEVRLHGPSEEAIREIVRLGTEFGIITEYTSFLVEENGAFGLTAENVARCSEELRARASASTGPHGFSQAANTKVWQRAQQVGSENRWRDAAGRERRVLAVRSVGSKTFVRRGNRWIDASCREDAPVIEVRLFSDEYFALARRAAEAARALALGEEVTLALEGKVYRIVAR